MNDDHTQTREHVIEIELLANALQLEQQWLERLRHAAQDYLDRPNPVTRGKLKRVLEAIERHRVR